MASSLEGNKIIAAILTAGIIASGSGVISRILYSPHRLEEPVYLVAGAEPAATTAAPAEPDKPLPVLLAAADPAAGEKISAKCKACHSLEKGGPNKVGPDLWDVVERPVGKHEGFSYSSAMEAKGGEWTYDDLFQFLHSPKDYLPGTKMTFAGLPKATDRADLLAFLRTLSDDPKPLPPPAG
jgi:cytochrome c